MKNILYINHTSSFGGASFCLLNLLKELNRKEYCPFVLLKEEGPLAVEIRKLGIEVTTIHSINMVFYNETIVWNMRTLKIFIRIFQSRFLLSRWLKKRDFDLVHINSMMLYPYLKVAKRMGIKSIIHVREHWPKDEHTVQRSIAVKSILNYSDGIIAINKNSASTFLSAKKQVSVIYDAIDMGSRYKNMPFDEVFGEDCSNLKVFLFTGGFIRIKGAYEVISTFYKKMINDDYRLLVLDSPPKKGENEINDEILYILKSDSRIRCIPRLYEISHLIEQAYCVLCYFIIPHANLALAESIILKTPVVASETPESIEYSCGGRLANLYELGNIDAFYNSIEDLIKNHSAIKERLANEALNVINIFSPKANADLLNQFYKNLTVDN